MDYHAAIGETPPYPLAYAHVLFRYGTKATGFSGVPRIFLTGAKTEGRERVWGSCGWGSKRTDGQVELVKKTDSSFH